MNLLPVYRTSFSNFQSLILLVFLAIMGSTYQSLLIMYYLCLLEHSIMSLTLDRLRDFGVKTEFLGRVGLIYNTKPLTLEDLYSILECSDLLQNYLDLFFNVNREQVISDLKGYLESSFRNNTLGARTINTLIHQYFIKGGKNQNGNN